MIDLDTVIDSGLGINLFDARGINNNGEIVANGLTRDRGERSFLLTPVAVPEPSSLGLFAAVSVAGVLVFVTRRRQDAPLICAKLETCRRGPSSCVIPRS
jgi:hypothetical protein